MSSKNVAFPKGLLLSVAGFLHQKLESPPRSLTCLPCPMTHTPASFQHIIHPQGGPQGQRRPIPLECQRRRSPFEPLLSLSLSTQGGGHTMAHSPSPALGKRLGIRMSILSHKFQSCSKAQSSSTARPMSPWQRPARTPS